MRRIEVKEMMFYDNPILIAKDGDRYAVITKTGIMIIHRTKCFDIHDEELDKAFQDGNAEPFIVYMVADMMGESDSPFTDSLRKQIQ